MTQLLGPQGTPASSADFRAQEHGFVWPSGVCHLRRRPDFCPLLYSRQGFFENPERPGANCVSLRSSEPHRNFFFFFLLYSCFLNSLYSHGIAFISW